MSSAAKLQFKLLNLSQLLFIKEVKKMNFEVFFQLTALLLIVAAGPMVIVLLFSRNGNI